MESESAYEPDPSYWVSAPLPLPPPKPEEDPARSAQRPIMGGVPGNSPERSNLYRIVPPKAHVHPGPVMEEAVLRTALLPAGAADVAGAPAPLTQRDASGRLILPWPPSSASGRRPRGSGSTVRIALGADLASGYWKCNGCGVPLPKADVVKGSAVLHAGRLACARCLRKAKKPPSALPALGVLAVLATVLLALCSPWFPGQALFLVFLACLGATLTGALSFHLRPRTRAGLVCLGLAAGVPTFFGLGWIQERQELRAECAGLSQDLEEIRSLMQDDQFAEAHSRFLILESKVQRQPGQFVSAGAKEIYGEAVEVFDEWFRSRFGAVGAKERSLLSHLCTRYPVRTVAGAPRFPSLRLDDGKKSLRLKAFVDTEKLDQAEGLAQGEALLSLLFSAAPELNEIELELASCSAAKEVKDWGTFRATPNQSHPLRGAAGKTP